MSIENHSMLTITNSVLIKKEDVELGESSLNILEIASQRFSHLFHSNESDQNHSILERIKNLHNFPRKLGKDQEILKDLIRLCYLATFTPNEQKSPFTEEELKIFRESAERGKYTIGWFKKAIIPFVIVSGASYVSFVSATQLSENEKAAFSGTVGLISSVALNMLSLCITGTNPNSSKDADNLKQNTIQDIKDKYNEMAAELIKLYDQQQEFAKLLACRIDMDQIARAAIEGSLDPKEEKAIFKKFKDAIKFVKGERAQLRHHDLRLFISQK